MKEVEIENREKHFDKKNGESDSFFMVDLIVDGQKIETGDNPISSYSFWEDMNDQTQRALYRIKKNNPKRSFNFNIATMGAGEEQLEQGFRNHIKGKYPEMDVDGLFDLVDKEVGEFKLTGPDDNHPNPELKFPIGSQATKNFIISVLDKFLKEKNDE